MKSLLSLFTPVFLSGLFQQIFKTHLKSLYLQTPKLNHSGIQLLNSTMVYQTYQRTLEPQKQTFNMCYNLLVSEVLQKQECCSVAKFHMVDHVGVIHHDISGCSNKKWFLRLGIRNISSM